MDPSIAVALVALLGSIFSVGLTLYGQSRATSKAQARDAEAILAKYREPLLFSAFDLQSRVFNIWQGGFLNAYYGRRPEGDPRREYALENTLYVVAQYFAWSEIVRRKIQLLSFSDAQRTRQYRQRQEAIVELFNRDDLGELLMIWRGEQRAIGEIMITNVDGDVQCLGYAAFRRRLNTDADFAPVVQSPEAGHRCTREATN